MGTLHGRRRLLGLVVAALAFGVSSPVDAAVRGVDQIGNSFSPQQIEIRVNDKVIWTNRSSLPHSVTFDSGPDLHEECEPLLALGCQAPGQTAERTFTTPGTFPYHCKIHGDPGGRGMAGVVVVAPVSTSSTTVPAPTSTTVRATTTTRATTSTTTSTTRPLATSSTLASSSTTSTTPKTSSVLLPGDPPPFSDDVNSSAAGRSGGPDNGSDTTTVALIVALLLAVSAGGGYLLWRLRPGRA